MTLEAKDFKRLKWAFILLLALASTGAAAIFGAYLYYQDSDRKNLAANSAHTEVKAKLARARDEEQELKEKITRYQQLAARGYIGNEMRLDWVEAIARIKAARRIFQLDYEFAPQRLADASILPSGASGGGFDFMSSQMRLQVQLLHEEDLLNLISDLRKEVQAIIHVRNCTIDRITGEPEQRINGAQLKGECTLEWITLKEKK